MCNILSLNTFKLQGGAAVIEIVYLASLGICLALGMGFVLMVLGCMQLGVSRFRKQKLAHDAYPVAPDQRLAKGEYPADQD